MSVNVWQRNPNESSTLFLSSLKFCKHILTITKNPKIFNVEYKELLIDRLDNDAIDIN